ncbi:CorA family Mg2+ transporter protein [Toxoplasma gondii TgCatPRC2]|uniref:Magnesium transporter n=14 Tax=Toxoplasma gondii TaxID=5811 RepID=B9PG28_TOXGV|nr:CorA family Mg2+ transporter protein [Toxoplasma gondii ME49]EPR64576.1 CorA family Mg2+ transporter protein [Toxoplasma gondii GT1]ESS36046.1 CorA family Mg2+ transporter protein [Toxoplasma gondii VEG]KAF4641997.1 CorA family Mg2+ transporter protein [Toxoplasma gondii]KFG49023.1 CorA family Mg2+ transporter protein [Toxoplasma gondii GAB2-2007-GAL-DOM2]KFG49963.1 CorA family Mg2+ transporter protein [Toxoplasma gondii FOU]KFG51532.1 CorA family Mg2+ transporter protein [Toxoplasma gondi|eukprot:XP_002365998.1 CorA family Mg2+ transporter protein [Toxoplasma gondii ME49]
MEQYIIDPLGDSPSGSGSEEDFLLPRSAKNTKLERPSSRSPHLTRAGSVPSSLEVPWKRSRESRGYLQRKLSRLRERAERKSIVAGKLSKQNSGDETAPTLRRSTTLMQHVAARSRAFVVYAISKQGVEEFVFQICDLLAKIHQHSKEEKPPETCELAPGAVKVRDIRLFLSAGSDGSSIITRRNCLLVSLPYVRIVILHRLVYMLPLGRGNFSREARKFEQTEWRCELLRQGLLSREEDEETKKPNSAGASLILGVPSSAQDKSRSSVLSVSSATAADVGNGDASPPTEIDSSLLEKLEQLVALNSSTPFEYLALETAIVESLEVLSRQSREMRQTAVSICADLRTGRGVNSSILLSINSLQKMLNTIKSEVAGVLTALNDVLGDDESLRRMAISRFWDTPELWEDESREALSHSTKRAVKHEIEMLLGCYSQEADAMLKNVKSIDEYIDDSLAMIELHLGMQRNFLLKTDVWMTALATITGFFALVPGFFGMNIHHGFENIPSSETIFWSISAAIFMGTIITGIVVSWLLRRIRI